MSFHELIEKGEIARERKNYDRALLCFDLAINRASDNHDLFSVIEALGHRLLIYKHKFKKKRNRLFLELMLKDAEACLAIASKMKLPKEVNKVGYLRIGDYHYLTGAYTKAVTCYKKAISCIPKNKTNEIAEYQSHYGLALVKTKRIDQGLKNLFESLVTLRKSNSLTGFRRLTIESGILMRLSEGSRFAGNHAFADDYLEEAKQLAEVLETKHKMSNRLEEIEEMERDIKKEQKR
jgi:tetratricopeptide (TPR) repeat protein